MERAWALEKSTGNALQVKLMSPPLAQLRLERAPARATEEFDAAELALGAAKVGALLP